MVTKRNWSQLPQEILELITRRLPTFEDYLSFVGVCQSWRSILVARHHYAFIRNTFPWLMLPEPEEVDDGSTYEDDDDDDDHNDLESRSFFSLVRNKVYHFDLPEAVGCHCWGSPYGWLVTCRDGKMNILNPLSNVCVALPPLTSLPNYSSSRSVRKVVLAISAPASSSSSLVTPLVNQFVALVMFSGHTKLAFARPGDRAWATVNSSSAFYEDIVHINDQFYTIDVEGVVSRFDISTPNQVSLHFTCLPGEIDMQEGCRFYLVELLGELHMVARFFYLQARDLDYYHLDHARPFEEHHHAQTSSFQVFKLDLCTKEWEEVYTLGKYAFFLGNNTSFSLRVSEYPGCHSNAIYFTDDYNWESTLHMEGQHGEEGMESIGLDMGVFNLKTKRVKPFYDSDDVPTFLAPPIWVTPNLY